MALASTVVQTMIQAVRKAARPMARDFGEVSALQVSRKGPGDFVTAADTAAEQSLFESLMKARPGYGFLGEERGLVEGTDKSHTWIVDPIDGTTNFMHAMPHFAITVGLEREGQMQAGVTFNPITNDLFWAERGKGCYLNDTRVRVSGRKDLTTCLIGTGLPFIGRAGHAQTIKEIHAVGQRVAGIRRLGSAALDLAWVACGRYDGFWERNLKPWDVAAGLLFVTEAGGRVSTIENEEAQPFDGASVIATNAECHGDLLKVLRTAL
ncbi:inositol monophosphatase family protein [Brevundimonas sp. 2R-24]|uniref:Inositol-1-monophosphatase n=1 Tax=Peiella sedimenti TaxID=3061083 RepID=A0ABT8SGU8_9CAUL|nr:inositol monophosphatase family protein [Caulobacteraceae bacterium XZ-24]